MPGKQCKTPLDIFQCHIPACEICRRRKTRVVLCLIDPSCFGRPCFCRDSYLALAKPVPCYSVLRHGPYCSSKPKDDYLDATTHAWVLAAPQQLKAALTRASGGSVGTNLGAKKQYL